ncbi:hypothetical protein sS8_0388 [Methylocaldum marinum]|uniref:Uncharacterized protein n=1 Tax=Methylocaldum marinum TaxID=1432792 RepID=A0A286P3Y4_9GAMM|nr:hypothetical protein sS8_0388 [Methylocaldum marinum]
MTKRPIRNCANLFFLKRITNAVATILSITVASAVLACDAIIKEIKSKITAKRISGFLGLPKNMQASNALLEGAKTGPKD